MAQRLIPLGRAPDPRLEPLSLMHDTRLAAEFGALADRGIFAANGMIGRPLNEAQVWPDGLTALDRVAGQAIQFDSNFGVSTSSAFVALFGVTVPSSNRHGAWIKIGTAQPGDGAGVAFGLGWDAGTGGFGTDNGTLVGLFEHRAWLNSGATVGSGFHTVAFALSGSILTFYVDGVQVAATEGGLPPHTIAPFASIGGYTGSSDEHRYTGCKLHFCVLANLRAGASNFADIAALAAELYPAGEYVPNVPLRNVIYSLPSGPISLSWSSLTASNITQTGATLTLGGITR